MVHTLEEVHATTLCQADWTRIFPKNEFVRVDFTYRNDNGTHRTEDIYEKKEWDEIRAKGYFKR